MSFAFILLAIFSTRPTVVHRFNGPMPTGVAISAEGRLFACFPRWDDKVSASVVELKGDREIPFPDPEINRDDRSNPQSHFVSVQSVVIDPRDRLWVLDSGAPKLGPTIPSGAKLVGIDLKTNKPFKTISFPRDVVTDTTYLNDVRFDMRDGDGFALITDSGDKSENGIIVVDLRSGQSWRRLANHPTVKADMSYTPIVEGWPLLKRTPGTPPQKMHTGSDGIALANDGTKLYYSPLNGRHLYSVDLTTLEDLAHTTIAVDATVQDEGTKPGSDGLLEASSGTLYATDYEHHCVIRRKGKQPWETAFVVPPTYWPDTLALSRTGDLYVICNELQRQARFHNGTDMRRKPYLLMRWHAADKPVLLR
jgi:sugar lactone lactonase YvrE